MIFSVTYYSKFCSAIIFYLECKFIPSKVIYVGIMSIQPILFLLVNLQKQSKKL